MKRITEFVSQCYETDSVIRFIKKIAIFFETEYRFRFITL